MPLPILSLEQMRAWEQATWQSGVPEQAVIDQVGRKLAARIGEWVGPEDRVLLLAGKGHNGDDVRAAAENLGSRSAILLDVSDPEAALLELARQLESRPALVVDGLFGIGLNRPLSDAWIKLIEAVNASGAPTLAVDVPSGLNAETGEHFGAAIRADVTLTIGVPKAGLLRQPAWEFTGRLEVAADVGLGPIPPGAEGELFWTLASDFSGFPPRRAAASHKGSYGHACLIAGAPGYHGAAVLAARGAARGRPGLVTVLTPGETYGPIAGQLQSTMVRIWRPGLAVPDNTTAALIGPGLAAPGVRAAMENDVLALWRRANFAVVADASALDWLPPVPLSPLPPRVITPHPGEAARLLRRTVAEIEADRVRAVRDLSRRYSDCHVVLKGHQTLVGRSTGTVFVNSSGNPGLAQGGAGDLLSGLITGLLAQPKLQADPMKTIRYAVWRHGNAADRLAAMDNHWTIEQFAGAV